MQSVLEKNPDGDASIGRAVTALNAVGVGAAGVFAILGARRPGFSKPDAPQRELAAFWAASSAVRTGALVVALGRHALRRQALPVADLVEVAGLVQLGDAALGVWRRNPQMALLPALMASAHLLTARRLRPPLTERTR